MPGIYVDDTFSEIGYVHILLDQHEVLFANGAHAETLCNGPEARKVIGAKNWFGLEVGHSDAPIDSIASKPARLIPENDQQKSLIARHRKNNKPLFDRGVKADTSAPEKACGPDSGGRAAA